MTLYAPRPHHRPQPAPRPRVLVVLDDDLLARALYRAVSHSAELTFVTVAAAPHVIGRFDLVVVEMAMPDPRGFLLHEQIARRDPWLAGRMMFVSCSGVSRSRELIGALGSLLTKISRTR
jgi:hypothetical protein